MNRDELNQVYLQTNYIAETATGEIVLRVGEKSAAIDDLLKKHGAQSWAFLTAYNPRSEELPESGNQVRQEKLLAELKKAGFDYLSGRGAGDDWTSEPSVLILDVEKSEAVRIARRFEQNAIVFGTLNHSPELVWCD